MAEESMAAKALLSKMDEPEFDFLRETVRYFIHELMEEEVSALIGAGRYERSESRCGQRNGVRHRNWDTRVGTLDLAIPKLRTGTYFPSWLEPRRRAEQALVTVVAPGCCWG